MRKVIVAIADGMGDLPCPSGGNSPLQQAATPTLDSMARHAVTGLCHTIPPMQPAGTETGLPALMGYSPEKYKLPRGPLEALGYGISLDADSVVWRLNIVSIDEHSLLHDFSAGHIDNELALPLFRRAQALAHESLFCVQGTSFRHLLVQRHNNPDEACALKIPAPHESHGTPLRDFLRCLQSEPDLQRLITGCLTMPESIAPDGKRLMLWPWGQGSKPTLPPFEELHGRTAAMVAGIPLAKGIAVATGMSTPDIIGCTGDEHTCYRTKAEIAASLLQTHETVFVHLEATDLCGHRQHFDDKCRAIERFDSEILHPLKQACPDAVFVVTCDHLTPVQTGRHHCGPVPFMLHDTSLPDVCGKHFCEKTAALSGLIIPSGPALLHLALTQGA
ncbi:alkaline phosphatase family protein [Oleidesulfovibrio sp.]|uniref:alkaline phosphatase family protein n=1 Tax=Oleidesulfovibrio sp. TaxID=2909707 RepID=UPI003A8A5669